MSSQTKAMIMVETLAVYMTSVGVASAEPEPEPGQETVVAESTDPASSPVEPADEDARNAASLDAYREQRYTEAMRAFEALWEEFGRIKYLYNAAISHEVLGHDAQAYVYFRRCQTHPDLSADMRAEVDERLNALRRRTVLLRIQSTADLRAPGVRVELRYRSLHGLTDPERAPLTLAGDVVSFLDERGDAVFYVERGVWGASVAGPGRKIESGTIEISGESLKTAVLAVSRPSVPNAVDKKIALSVEPSIHEERRRWTLEQQSRRLTLGLGTGSALTFVGGTILTVYSAVRWNDEHGSFLDATDFTPRNAARLRLEDILVLQVAGAGVVGGGLGLGLNSLMATKPRRPRVWVAPLVLGAGALAGGVFGSLASYDSFVLALKEQAESGEHASLLRPQVQLLAASAVMGLGGGLLVGSFAGVIHSAVNRRRNSLRYSFTPQLSAAGAGFVLRGRF